jgi:hypothetical protein
MFADEAARMTQAQAHIACVANNDALQPKQFLEVNRPAPSLSRVVINPVRSTIQAESPSAATGGFARCSTKPPT